MPKTTPSPGRLVTSEAESGHRFLSKHAEVYHDPDKNPLAENLLEIISVMGERYKEKIKAWWFDRAYVDVGADHYEQQYRERVLKSLAKRAAQFGLALAPAGNGSGNHAGRG